MAELRFVKDAELLLASLSEDGRVVVDADCGRGRYAELFVNAGCTVLAFQSLTPLPPSLEASESFTAMESAVDETLVPFRTVNGVWTNESLAALSPDGLSRRLQTFCDWLVPQGTVALILREGEGQKIVELQGITGLSRQLVHQYQPEVVEAIIRAAGFVTTHAWRSGPIESTLIHLIIRKA